MVTKISYWVNYSLIFIQPDTDKQKTITAEANLLPEPSFRFLVHESGRDTNTNTAACLDVSEVILLKACHSFLACVSRHQQQEAASPHRLDHSSNMTNSGFESWSGSEMYNITTAQADPGKPD